MLNTSKFGFTHNGYDYLKIKKKQDVNANMIVTVVGHRCLWLTCDPLFHSRHNDRDRNVKVNHEITNSFVMNMAFKQFSSFKLLKHCTQTHTTILWPSWILSGTTQVS